MIKRKNFNITLKDEKELENNFMAALDENRHTINGKIYSQRDKATTVRSVYLFGKKHRPDLTINEDGIAIELKFLNSTRDGLKQALGQSMFYRVRYRFVVNLFVVDQKHKSVYLGAAEDKERDLEEILKDLAADMNIFSYIVPNFLPGSNVKSLIEWNGLGD